LVSSSSDSSIIFYHKDNLEYKNSFKISTNGGCSSVIQTKDNEICYSEENNNTICFYDLLEKKIKASLSDISKYNGVREWHIMMTKDLLLIPGENKMSIINVNHYKLIRVIEVSGSSWICGVCILNKNMILTGDYSEIIRQWRIEGDNLVLVSKKEKTHNSDINILLNMGNGYIASGSDDRSVKIW
jgi:WD40 repeat protein